MVTLKNMTTLAIGRVTPEADPRRYGLSWHPENQLF
jgi:hypothetical protein